MIDEQRGVSNFQLSWDDEAMNVVITGSSGPIGSALMLLLTRNGHTIRRLIRGARDDGAARWNPDDGLLDERVLSGADAVVHLAGEPIAAVRWTAAKKARIRDSRVRGTSLLTRALVKLARRPTVFISASAVGIYGNRGDEVVDERSAAGHGFLAGVCSQWEAATRPAADAGIRVVNCRMGVVLTGTAGALAKMLPPFRLGLGGVMGSGRQYMSWISIDDVVGAIQHLLLAETVVGPVNLVAPNPVTNREFTKTLGRVLRRPTSLRVPAFAVRLGLGEVADELLLASIRALPLRLIASGYQFRYPTLEGALRHLLIVGH
jgi:uncharacterized protein (TIGR01777 family)